MKHASNETKAAVVAAMLSGSGVMEVSRNFGIPQSTVSRWKNEDIELRPEVGDLLLSFLQETFITVTEIQIRTREPEWIDRQEASSLAVYLGVSVDKGIRLLEALSNANIRPTEAKDTPVRKLKA